MAAVDGAEAREALEELASSGETAASFARRRGDLDTAACVLEEASRSGRRRGLWRLRCAAGRLRRGLKSLQGAWSSGLSVSARFDEDHVARLVEAIGRRMSGTC